MPPLLASEALHQPMLATTGRSQWVSKDTLWAVFSPKLEEEHPPFGGCPDAQPAPRA
jgi:hypothetical protein